MMDGWSAYLGCSALLPTSIPSTLLPAHMLVQNIKNDSVRSYRRHHHQHQTDKRPAYPFVLFFLSHTTLFYLVQKKKSANCLNKCSARRTCRCRWQACHVVSCHSFHAAPSSSSCLGPKQRGLHQRSSYFCDCCCCRCHEWR
ncbi:uncharacterized protein IWZ02DRAFT_142296 [Phyllosticta citriasiana]|uniref:Secreted protein n=1 Tax=Phyllosticta citriasiana TaxID=595635 RepID=A0ABR1KTK7_9PEZI